MLERLFEPHLPVIVQGIGGRQAGTHARLMRDWGTRIVGGVSKRHAELDWTRVFPDCASAVQATGAKASVIMVPALEAAAALDEALAAGIRIAVCLAEGIPVHDALRMARAARAAGALYVGASTPGIAIPGLLKLGFLPDVALRPGPLAILSKSGTLSYETAFALAESGLGQSIWVGVGGDAVKGLRFADAIPFLASHAPTRAVVIVGEIGGTEEEDMAEAMRRHALRKPVFALLAGSAAPSGVTMGHAGALIDGSTGSIASKTRALEAVGAQVFSSVRRMTYAVRAGFSNAPP